MAVTSPRRRTAGRTWLLRLLLLTLVTSILAGTAVWHVAGRVVPRLEGEAYVAGLHAPVEVLFDKWAVPHVYARDTDDAWFAAGYLQARDRLWKMELYRRAAAGRLSELFGERTLPSDRRFRALGLRRAAASELAVTTPRARQALDRYAAGANAAIATLGRWQRPIEFQLLGIVPEPWTPLDSLAVGKLMAWRLAENRHGELVRGAVVHRFGLAAAERLMGMWPLGAPTILGQGEPARPVQAGGRGEPEAPATRASVQAPLFDFPDGLEWLATTARPAASNSWVIAGARTASGRPLLANDPHLGLEMPSIWYEAHLVAAELDVAGAMLPGSPFVVIGHNPEIAWGITNASTDTQDFFVEDVDFQRGRYLYGGTWRSLRVDRVEIGVRGRAADEFDVFSTRHGPLIATERDWEEPPQFSAATRRGYPRPLALRWDSIRTGECGAPFEALNRAKSWRDFLEAVRRIAAPSLSFVYADRTGNIGYALSGALPVRAQGDGSLPVPGWTGDHEWIGVVPPERLPSQLNPASGQFVTANSEIDRRWPGTMTRDWTAPFRMSRLVTLLGSRTGLDAAASREMQADVRSEAANRLLDALEMASRSPAAKRAESEARTALERLRLWDRKIDGRPIVSLFQAFEQALWHRTFADEMDAVLFQQFFEYGLGERFVGIQAILDDADARWWDDIATIDRRETRDDIIVLAAADALLALRRRFGDEPRWTWERIHAAHFRHSLSAAGPVFRWAFDRGPVPVTGDSTTPNKTGIDRRRPYGVTDIASYRQIIDVGAWDETRAVNTTGQSGHPHSPHYFDQNALWQRVQDRPFPFSRAAVEKARTSRLLLIPQSTRPAD